MTCEEAQNLMLSVPAETALSQHEADSLESHLATCASCCLEFERLRSLALELQVGWGALESPGAFKALTVDLPHDCAVTRRQFISQALSHSIVKQDATSDAVRAHLDSCPSCAAACLRIPIVIRALATASIIGAEPTPLTCAEDGWHDLLRREPGLADAVADQERKRWSRRLFRSGARAAAMAACILLLVSVTRSVLWKLSPRLPASSPVATTTPLPHAEKRFYAEILTPTGRREIALGQTVAAGSQRQEILLGGMHRVIMSPGTSAAFAQAQNGAYEIALPSGRIYVEVVPGNPFIVHTSNALLTITGTKFDVTAQPLRTDLVLVKGSIRFSRDDGAPAVTVSAGHGSSVSSGSGPTTPLPVDARAITAWARDAVSGSGPATTQGNDDITDSLHTSWRQTRPADVESLDYARWRDEHREWFAWQFPSAFAAQTALATHGIHADYIDLLMISGQLWQFHYATDRSAVSETTFDAERSAKIAAWYGVDAKWLGGPSRAANSTTISDGTNIRTRADDAGDFRRWQADMAEALSHPDHVDPGLLASTLEASIRLSNTRTAAFLWVTSHPEEARRLLDSADLRRQLSQSLPTDAPTYAVLCERFHEQVVASEEARHTAQNLLTGDDLPECGTQYATLQRLQILLAKLAPSMPTENTRSEGGAP
jgi:hypothetical protein